MKFKREFLESRHYEDPPRYVDEVGTPDDGLIEIWHAIFKWGASSTA